eukprot:3183413-Amphidinium_carterae.1
MQSGGVAFEVQHADVCSLLALNRTRQRHEHSFLEVVSTSLARCPFAEQGQQLHALDAIRLEARASFCRHALTFEQKLEAVFRVRRHQANKGLSEDKFDSQLNSKLRISKTTYAITSASTKHARVLSETMYRRRSHREYERE